MCMHLPVRYKTNSKEIGKQMMFRLVYQGEGDLLRNCLKKGGSSRNTLVTLVRQCLTQLLSLQIA